MRRSWTPSIVPDSADQTVYIVLDDFGRLGRADRETDVERSDLESVIGDVMSEQYNPVRVVAFNTTEPWSEDVSEDSRHRACRRPSRRSAPQDQTAASRPAIDRR
jgi:hypothetical protein